MTKSKLRTFLISVSLAVAAVCLSVGIAACSGGEKENKNAGVYNVGEEGIYYYDAGSSEYLLTLQSGVYMISVGGSASSSGTYSCDEEAGTITFTPYDGDAFTASLSDGAMKLDIGTAYTFLKKVNYDVTFMSGSETVDSQSVTYGKAAEAVDGEKDGYIFLGWYADPDFTTKYSFDSAVTGDVTLYARYVELDSTIANFDVTFIADGEVVYETKTQNGVVYDIPEYSGILGWWVSDTNSGDALTYKYDGEILTEATKLFAVEEGSLGASVYGDKVTWEGSSSSVTITVDGAVVTSSAANGSYAYDFSSLSTGSHEITLSASGYRDETLVYVARRLDRVSNFSVYGTTLVYNAVADAQYYYISVTCGNSSHEHEMVYNGNTLTYDFSDCEMGPEGISFTVYAYAQGYVESVSETFVYALILDGTTVAIDVATDTATWTSVSGATGYEVYVNGELATTTTDTEYSFKNEEKGTEIEIAVKPVAPGYYSEISGSVNYTKSTLKAPEIISVSGYEISWEKIDEATSYELNINGYLVTVEPKDDESEAPTTYVISDTALGYIFSDARNAVSVTAIAKDPSENSQQGDITYVTDAVMSSAISYADGVITWDYALAADSYTIELDGSVVDTVSGTNTYDVTFTHSGESEIKVYFDESSFASLTVYTYAVIFDSQGGDNIDTIYVAKGDTVTLPDAVVSNPTAARNVFRGWYSLPDAGATDASLQYGGDGVLYDTTFVFDGNSTLILYAFYTGTILSITLDSGSYGTLDESSCDIVLNSGSFTLPVPELADTTKVFMGWYSSGSGAGTKYTDEYGKATQMFNDRTQTTLYARWGEALALSKITYNGRAVLEVKKGADIEYIQNGVLTVPATYVVDGTEYTVAVANSTAFYNSKYIYEVNLPDTMEYISTVNNGYSSGSGAFAQSANIYAVNIYATGEEPDPTKEVTYYSDDGVLYAKSSLTGEVELIYYPQAKTNTKYTVPEYVSNEYEYTYATGSATDLVSVVWPVRSIATRAFQEHPSITEITIPATVSNISSQAFYNCKKLTKVTILADALSADVTEADTLTISGKAFQSCTQLTDVTLSARMAADSFDYTMFDGCSKLTAVYVNAASDTSKNNYKSTDGGILLNGAGDTLVYYPLGRTEFTLSDSGVTTIGAYAVYGNTYIKSAVIPSWVKLIDEYAFAKCTSMATLTFGSLGDDNAADLSIMEQAFYGCTKLTELYLPQNVVHISAYAFGNCTKLTYVEFDSRKGATELDFETNAFSSVSSSSATSGSFYVTSVKIGANAPVIELAEVFGYNITKIDVDPDNDNYDGSYDGVLLNGDNTLILYAYSDYKGAVTLPEGITKIGDNLFRARKITSINIPSTVTEIGGQAFYNCTLLKSVTFDEGRDAESLTIGTYAFYGCSGLASINLPEGLTEIGDRAFQGCSGLTSLDIPEGVRSIGDYAFYGCTKLASLSLPASLESIGNETNGVYYVFYNCKALTSVTIAAENTNFAYDGGILYGLTAAESGEEYIKTDIYKALEAAKDELVLPSTVNNIRYRAFYQNTSITKLSFEDDTVTSLTIGSDAFNGCTALAEVVLPNGLTTISSGLFTNCSGLTKITIPNTVTSMAANLFNGTSITEIVFAEGGTSPLTLTGTSTSNFTFYGTKLTRITLPERLTEIPSYSFYKLTTLTNVYIPYTVTTIGQDAFAECSGLTNVTIQDEPEIEVDGEDGGKSSKLATIGKAAFFNCGFETITLPDSVVTLTAGSWSSSTLSYSNGGVFASCTKLKEITIPASITAITQSTFQSCTALASVTVSGEVTSIGLHAFRGDTALTTFTMQHPETLEEIDNYAFYQTALTSFEFGEKFESVGTYVFYQTKLASVTIPANLETIGTDAFYGCSELASLTFAIDETSKKSNLASIGESAFAGCTALTKIELPETTGDLTLYMYAFGSCTSLTEIHLSSTIKANSKFSSSSYREPDSNIYFVFDGSGEQVTTVTLAEGSEFVTETLKCKNKDGNDTTVILLLNKPAAEDVDATHGGTLYYVFGLGLTDGKLDLTGTGITTLNASCFARNDGNTALTEITIPYTVVNIGLGCFFKCTALTKVVFEDLPADAAVTDYSLVIAAGSSGGAQVYTQIGVFSQCSALESINLPERLTAIPADIFLNCTSLTSIHVPSTVTSIGKHAFGSSNSNQSITSITFAENSQLTTLDEQAFYYTTITEIELPEGVTSIGASAFYYSKTLTKVTLPSTVTELSEGKEFQYCSALEEIIFKASDVEISGTYTFGNCTSLKRIDLTGTTSIGANAFNGCSALETVVIPYTVTSIGENAFASCAAITSVEFEATPDNVEEKALTVTDGSSSKGAFYKCTGLKKAVLTDRLGTIAIGMFNGCTALKVLTYNGDTGYDEEAVGDGTYFALVDGVALGNYCFDGTPFVSVDVSRVSSIGNYVFENCTALTTIILPEDMTELPTGLLNGCTSITSFEIDENVTSIGASAFAGTSITTITIPEGVTVLADSVFSGCSYLTEVIYAEGQITSVGKETFLNCTALTSLDLSGLTTITGNSAFKASGLTEVSLPRLELTSVSTAASAFADCSDLETVELNPELTYIVNYMFQNCTSLTKIYYAGYTESGYSEDQNVLPGKLQQIGSGAFANAGLENIVIPGSVTSIGTGSYSSTSKVYSGGVFAESTALTTVVFEEGVQTVAIGMFSNCTGLVSVTIPYTVTTVGYGAFYECSALENVIFEDLPYGADEAAYALSFWGGTNTYQGVFSGCTGLSEIDIPYRTTELGGYMFYGCTAIEEITIPATVNYLLRGTSATNYTSYAYTFVGCSALTTVTFAAGSVLDNIGAYMFQNCAALETVSIPDSVTVINQYAFQNCSSLSGINIPDDVTNIATYAFSGSGLEEIYVPASVTTIGTRAFELCSNLTSIDVDPSNSTFRTVNGGLVNNNSVLVCVPAGTEGEYVVDDSLALTTTYAFNGCAKITGVVLGEGCTTVAANCFEGCTAIEYIVMPGTTVTVNSAAFKDTSSLESVYYMGTPESRSEMSINSTNNSKLTGASWYYYSGEEPANFTNDGTAFDADYWYYDTEGEKTLWEFTYTTYAVENGGYVLVDSASDVAYIGFVIVGTDPETGDETTEYVAYAAESCTAGTDGTYTVELENGATYTVTLSDAGAIVTAA